MAWPTAASVRAYRQNGVVILAAADTNMDGNQGITLQLPSELDVVYVLEVLVRAASIATMMTSPEINGPQVVILAAGGSPNLDFVGNSRWVTTNALTLGAQILPDAAALWSKGEALNVQFAEVDTNATPTVDGEVLIRCQTLQPVGLAPGPLLLTS